MRRLDDAVFCRSDYVCTCGQATEQAQIFELLYRLTWNISNLFELDSSWNLPLNLYVYTLDEIKQTDMGTVMNIQHIHYGLINHSCTYSLRKVYIIGIKMCES